MSRAPVCSECRRPLPVGDPPAERFILRVPEQESYGVLGAPRMGKSNFAKAWAAWLMKRGQAVVAWDPSDEYSMHGLKRAKNSLGPLTLRLTVPEFMARFDRGDRDFLLNKRLALAIVPSSPFLEWPEKAAEFKALLRPLRWRSRLVLMIDECGQLQEHADEALVTIANDWPKDLLPTIFIGQVAGMFSPRVRQAWRGCIAFQQPKESDRRLLAPDFGAAFASELATLAPGHYRVGLRAGVTGT